LLDADRAQQRQKRFRGFPHALIDALAAQQALNVQVAYLDATPLAAMLFIMHRPVVTYHLGWTNFEDRQWGQHNRILIDAAATFADHEYHRVDLETVDTDNAPGLARFKIGSGAQIRGLGGSWLRFGLLRG
jgi:lipid II:glycine glycyltransferase (peptidoglycan interpeptide bridge formation enzyme)